MEHCEIMERVKPYPLNTVYIGKGWKGLFRCNFCKKEIWQAMNFIGNKNNLCCVNGKKKIISKI